jgi:ferredoxin
MVKIVHQRKKCAGCGICAAMCPDFFEMDSKDNLARLKNSKEIGDHFELKVENADYVKDAASMCPVKIIKIENQ